MSRIIRSLPALSAAATAGAAYALYRRRFLRPAKLTPPSIATARIAGSPQPWLSGNGLAGFCWPAVGEARANVLLQHGYGEYSERFVVQYSGLIPQLQQLGCNVYAFDLWGHGYSPGTRGLVDAHAAVRDHRRARRELVGRPQPLFLIGHSLGGLITAAGVLDDPRGISGVILLGAALQFSIPDAQRRVLGLLSRVAPTLPAPVSPAGWETLYRGASRAAITAAAPLMYQGRFMLGSGATMVERAERNWERVTEWLTPLLVMHGSADQSTDPDGSVRFYEMVSSRDRTLELIEDGAHELLNDVERERVLQTMLNWLDSRIAGRKRTG
jgi:acylglycerol lipase